MRLGGSRPRVPGTATGMNPGPRSTRIRLRFPGPSGDSGRWPVQIASLYARLVAVLLLIVGLGKAWDGLRWPLVAPGPTDPVFALLTTRQMALAAAMLEVAVAVRVLRAGQPLTGLLTILWLASVLVAYRIGLRWVGFDGSCGCLGAWPTVLRFSSHTSERLASGALTFMITGSLACVGLLMALSLRAKMLPRAYMESPAPKPFGGGS